MSYVLKIQSKIEIIPKTLINGQKMRFFLIYILIRAKPGFDLDISGTHNLSDQETVEFLSRNFPV